MKRSEKLSDRQRGILHFMEHYIKLYGFPPTIREIGEATNINSTSVVNYNLNKLVQLGYLERSATKSRGLRLIKSLSQDNTGYTVKPGLAINVRLEGQIIAGQPVEYFDNPFSEDNNIIEVTPMLLNGADPAEVFALRVKGDSMIDAMVQDGDVIILRRTTTARNGEMVAVWITSHNETTLKYFYKEGDKVRLQPAHPSMDAIYVDAFDCLIQGRVVSVIRTLK